jgi:hypothetical protein
MTARLTLRMPEVAEQLGGLLRQGPAVRRRRTHR